MNFKSTAICTALMCSAFLLAYSEAEPTPDFHSNVPVVAGDREVSLSVDAWHADASLPCRVRIRGEGVSNYVRADGNMPRGSLAPTVVQACTGKNPYLSSTSGGVWEASAGPESAAPLTIFHVKVNSVSEGQALLELRVATEAVQTGGAEPLASKAEAKVASSTITRDEVIEARNQFDVQVLSFDKDNVYGTGYESSTLVRLRISNNSSITLPQLTPLTKRWSVSGEGLGESRAPFIPVGGLKPGETIELDYYARGSLPGTDRITVEVEKTLSPETEKFMVELPK